MDADPNTRKEICSQITESLYFRLQRKDAIDMDKRSIYKKLKHKRKYETLFNEIYEKAPKRSFFERGRKYRYVNPYRPKTVRIDGLVNNEYLPIIPRQEYTFVCLVRQRSSSSNKAKIAYYVSKEYNVFTGQSSQHIAGRFVFKPPTATIQLVILAEEPAKVHESPDFNLELHYLQIRRDREPGRVKFCNSMIPSVL